MTLWIICFTLGFTLIFGGSSGKYFLWYLRTVQIVVHLPMFKTVIPGNVNDFFEIMILLLTFDILDAEWTTMLVFEFDLVFHAVNTRGRISE